MAELTVPQVDFSSLGQLPAIYKQGQTDAVRQQTLASLGQGGTADVAALLRSGDLSLAQLGINMQNKQGEEAWRREESARAQKNADRSYGLQARAAARADEGPVEQAGYRAQVAQKYGIDPNSMEGRAFIVSGKLPESATGGDIAGTAAQRAAVAKQYGIEPASPEGKAFILSGKLPDSIANGGTPEVGLQPAYGTGPDGKVGAIQFSKTGKAVQTQLPEGFSLSKEPIKVDMGTHVQLYDPITRQPVGNPISKNLAGVEREKAVGEATGAAEVALPQVIANSDALLKTLDGIDKHPGKKYSLGLYSKAPTIPGTAQADFRARLEQLQGQGFLQAYQTLRGGGAITDIEGTKGTNALMRMQTAQTEESFNQGLKDFKEVVQAGADRAKAKARGAGAPSSEQPTGTTTRLKFNPTTGALE